MVNGKYGRGIGDWLASGKCRNIGRVVDSSWDEFSEDGVEVLWLGPTNHRAGQEWLVRLLQSSRRRLYG